MSCARPARRASSMRWEAVGIMPDIAHMDYDDLAALEDVIDAVIDCRKTEEQYGLKGMDAVELKQLLSTVRDILDALDDAEAAALNAEYERSV